MKLKNYTVLDKQGTKKWDKLRDSVSHQSFFIPKNKNDYLTNLENFKPSKIVISDFEYLNKKFRLEKLISFCGGACQLEYHLMKKFDIVCEVSDNTNSIERINRFQIFDKSSKIDVNKNFKINVTPSTVILLSRIDTEFEDYQLEDFFKRLYESNAKWIYFIPAEIITFNTIIIKIKIFLICLLKLRYPVPWGYIRSRNSFEKIWKSYYSTIAFKKEGVILKIK